MTDQAKPHVTVEDLMDDQWVEVTDGELVEVDTNTMGVEHTLVITNLYDILSPLVRTNKFGYVHGDGLKYVLWVDENGVETSCIPDLAYVRRGRIPANFDRTRPFSGAPDFAVEVVSPGQSNPLLLDKVAKYLKYGTEELWMIFPARKELYQYRRDEQVPRIYAINDAIDMHTLFPGLKLSVQDLFVDPWE